MQKTWIFDLGRPESAAGAANGEAIDAVFAGFTAASGGRSLRWWHYQCFADAPSCPDNRILGSLFGAITAPALPDAPPLDPDAGTVFLIGSADQEATRHHFCHWAHRLALLQPADVLGEPGTIRRIGVLRLPEFLFTAGRATDEAFSAFLAQLANVAGSFEALYLVGDQISAHEFGAAVEVPAADRPYMLAQLLLHLSMPQPSRAALPSGICSAGAFALHADWPHFVEHCRWKFSADLWRKFMLSDQAPFFDPRELEHARKDGRLEPATRAEDWRTAFRNAIPGEFDLPSEFWAVPSESSPWRIWSGKLLDRDGFFEDWLRNWVTRLSEANDKMSAEVLLDSVQRVDALEREHCDAATMALRDDLDRLAGPARAARSKAQLDAFFVDAERRLRVQTGSLADAPAALFDFSSDPSVHEMLDRARKDVDEGRDNLAEAADLRGLTVRLQGHPSLLAMALRAVFASALLVVLVPPVLALLRAWRPESWLVSLPPEIWSVAAFAAPFAAMLLSVKYRHNHIRQHARKLTALAMARLEKRVAQMCSERLKSAFGKVADDVAGAREGFLRLCDELFDRLADRQPPLSRPELPVTAFQQPLLAGDGSEASPGSAGSMEASSRDGVLAPYASLGDEDFCALLRRLIGAGSVAPSFLAPDLDRQAEGRAVDDPAGRVIEATLSFAARELSLTDPEHRLHWEEAAALAGPMRREIALRSSPSIERQQGYDIAGGKYHRCSADMELPEFHRDIRRLGGFASWMNYHRFPHLAAAIQNPQTATAARTWLIGGLSQEASVREEFRAPASGELSIEAQQWSAVGPGDLLARVGSHAWQAANEGFVVFRQDEGNVAQGTVVGQVITFPSQDPRLLDLFVFVEAHADQLRTVGGGAVEGNADRIETYSFLARRAAEENGGIA